MQRYRIRPGTDVDLKDWDPEDVSAFPKERQEGRERFLELNAELEELQELLYAEHKHKVLIVLQAMDTAGKDGVIRHVFDGVNPQGVRVASFKKPTEEELDHDFLWRVHKQTPRNGEIVIFNRSHYEDVLVARVLELVPKKVWSGRYALVNEFERLLVQEGTTLLKFYLHIDKKEQKQRLQARLDDPRKRWKFDPRDLDARNQWSKYMKAYEDVLSKTSTPWAPWHIVPSNRKWYRNLIVSSLIVQTLRDLNMRFPEPKFDYRKIRIPPGK